MKRKRKSTLLDKGKDLIGTSGDYLDSVGAQVLHKHLGGTFEARQYLRPDWEAFVLLIVVPEESAGVF